jgi:hypothetical protein
MSHNNKNTTRKAQAAVFTAMHLRGEKGASRGAPSKKQNAWWQKGDYATFINGGKKPRDGGAMNA